MEAENLKKYVLILEYLKIVSDDSIEDKLLQYFKHIIEKETTKTCILSQIFTPVKIIDNHDD
jgi:hypothetical protein